MLYIYKAITYVILNYIIYFIISVTLIYFKSTFESVFICMKFYFVCLILPVSVINSKPFKDCAFISIGEQLITAEVFCCYHGLGCFAGVYLCFYLLVCLRHVDLELLCGSGWPRTQDSLLALPLECWVPNMRASWALYYIF